ncbi:hypothetical protein EMIHUDRAFT_452340 [Emiliania huxleyi CCMP1516]|uniref:HD domain-containing protein n=2 Tax=Emiliania huxleyi TaxID=2903 RepID=A0A0D3IKW4_EMIH1|nr:hypothetical protein EMIHUDRAFT_452340 [Emiliania huxleyi CCMP1516]EOD11899.1 hypothetical protein EMIHUDRAFT_452340 [Emiliania huxleyi CCMP1516]|eukprot:XP_005764328.1 hypothetical protein EMIHUDRAFT_452340 [Emiliania huxleyi CCMP1516]
MSSGSAPPRTPPGASGRVREPTPETTARKAAKLGGGGSSWPPAADEWELDERQHERPRKHVHDCVHREITLEPLLDAVTRTKAFQRLGSLRQLGSTHRVWPNATHTRKAHSLGVAYLAEKLCRNIAQRPMPHGVQPPDERDILLVKLAALCHDLGHGPFSHTFDNFVVPAAARRARDEGDAGLAKVLEKHKHEQLSVRLLRKVFAQPPLAAREDRLTEAELVFVEELILGGDLKGGVDARKGRGWDKRYLYDIVCNADSGLDMDKLDYLRRDPATVGMSGLVVPLLENAEVRLATFGGEARARPVICYPDKMSPSLFEVFRKRAELHCQLYTHKHVVAWDLLHRDFLLAADALGPVVGSLRLAETDAFLKMTDESVMARFEVNDNYKCVGDQIFSRKLTREELAMGKAEQERLVRRLEDGVRAAVGARGLRSDRASLEVETRHVHHGQRGRSPLDSLRFFGKGSARDEHAQPLPQRQRHDCLVPASFEDKGVRVFWKGPPEDCEDVREAVLAWERQEAQGRESDGTFESQ